MRVSDEGGFFITCAEVGDGVIDDSRGCVGEGRDEETVVVGEVVVLSETVGSGLSFGRVVQERERKSRKRNGVKYKIDKRWYVIVTGMGAGVSHLLPRLR